MDRTPHTLRVLNRKGDVATVWRPEVVAETMIAKAEFDRLVAEGHLMFETPAPGKTPEQVREFNPNAFEIVATPRFVGG